MEGGEVGGGVEVSIDYTGQTVHLFVTETSQFMSCLHFYDHLEGSPT